VTFLLLVFLGVGLIVWLIVRATLRHRRTEYLIAQLTSRIFKLENQVVQLSRVINRLEGAQPLTPAQAEEKHVPARVAAPEQPAPKVAPAPKQEVVPPAAVPAPTVPQTVGATPSAPPSQPPGLSREAPAERASAAGQVEERRKAVEDLEETVGTNWLSKLGVVILVLGIAFFLVYQLRTLGPGGKILVGYATGAALLVLGIYFERKDRYRIVARAGIGGGWALIYFTVYAMYHVQAARVMTSETLDLALMLVVAAGMVVHTLRYRSQVVTGLAFLLGFLTVTISHTNVYSLAAGAILGLALAVVAVRMRWFEMEVLGIAAAYLNHYLWLRPIIAARGPHPVEFQGYLASALLLTFYWLVFNGSYVVRKTEGAGRRAESVSALAALVNIGCYIWLMGYQSVHPELAFEFFLFVGAVELALGQLPVTRRRRTAFLILTTFGVTLLVAAFPYKFSGSALSVYWLAEAEALFLAGTFTEEILFRRLAMAATLLVAGHLVAVDAARVMGERMDGARVVREPGIGVIFALAAAIFYLNGIWLKRRRPNFAPTRYDAFGFDLISYAGGLMLFVGAWLVFPGAWTAVAWGALALGLAYAAKRWNDSPLCIQANFLAVMAILRAATVNLQTGGEIAHVSVRLVSVALAAALIYAFSRWSAPAKFAERLIVSQGYTWAASTLVALLLWYELRPVAVAPGWTLLGLVLLELGVERRSVSLRLQAYVAFVSSFLRVFLVNLNASGLPGQISPRLYTTVPLAVAFFYVYHRLTSAEAAAEEDWSLDRKLRAPAVHCFYGTIATMALLRFEIDADWVATAWAACAVLLVAIAWKSGRRLFLDQAFLVTAAVCLRTIAHNFYERSYFPAPFSRSPWLCVGATIALLLAALPMAFSLKHAQAAGAGASALRRAHHALHRLPEQFFFFSPFLLLTVLLAVEMRKGMVTVAWGAEAVAVFLFALWIGQRSFRLAGLGLLLLCVVKIVTIDVWRMQPRDRYVTFIVLGCALLLVSFLYTRYRETLRHYL
jgi:uncharacterized membrane protein